MGKQRPVLSALMAAIGLVALYRAEIRPRIYTWGAEDGEVAAQLPGDELVSEHARRTTRARAARREDFGGMGFLPLPEAAAVPLVGLCSIFRISSWNRR